MIARSSRREEDEERREAMGRLVREDDIAAGVFFFFFFFFRDKKLLKPLTDQRHAVWVDGKEDKTVKGYKAAEKFRSLAPRSR